MAILISQQPVNAPTGARTLGPVAVPDTLQQALITLKYCTTLTPTIWPNGTTTLQATSWVSLDAGVTWKPRSTWSTNGGIHLSKGVEIPETSWGFDLIPGSSRLLKIEIVVANGPLVSLLDVVAL
jgi:hypothetical protein